MASIALHEGVGIYEPRRPRRGVRIVAGGLAFLLGGVLAGCDPESGGSARHSGASGSHQQAPAHRSQPKPKPKPRTGPKISKSVRCDGITFEDQGSSGVWRPKPDGALPKGAWIEGKVRVTEAFKIAHLAKDKAFNTKPTGSLQVSYSPDSRVDTVSMRLKWMEDQRERQSDCGSWHSTERLRMGLGVAAVPAEAAGPVALADPRLQSLGQLADLVAVTRQADAAALPPAAAAVTLA